MQNTPMVHRMGLQPLPFSQVKTGTKIIESRLNDEKRQQIELGDTIEFGLEPDRVEIVETKVIELIHADTFSDLFDLYPPEAFGGTDKEDLTGIYKYYSKEDEAKYGVLGIRVELTG